MKYDYDKMKKEMESKRFGIEKSIAKTKQEHREKYKGKPKPIGGRPRSEAEQKALTELVKRRQKEWEESGKMRYLGDRKWELNIDVNE